MIQKAIVLQKYLFFLRIVFLIILWFFLCFRISISAETVQEYQNISDYLFGLQLEHANQIPEAIEFYQKALIVSPHNLKVRQRLMSIYLQENQLADLLQELETLVALEPANQEPRYVLADLQVVLGFWDQAIENFEIILQNPIPEHFNIVKLYDKLGELYYRQKKHTQAINTFLKVLEWEPQNSRASYLLGYLYSFLGETSKAIHMFKQCLQSDPLDALCLNALGYLYAEENIMLEEAEALVKQALILFDQEASFLDSLGWVYYRQGKYYDALKYITEALNYREDPDIYQHLGQVYEKLGAKDLAQYYAKKAKEYFFHFEPIRLTIEDLFWDWIQDM